MKDIVAEPVRGGLPCDGEVQFACSIVDIRHIPMRLGPQTAKPPTSNHGANCLPKEARPRRYPLGIERVDRGCSSTPFLQTPICTAGQGAGPLSVLTVYVPPCRTSS